MMYLKSFSSFLLLGIVCCLLLVSSGCKTPQTTGKKATKAKSTRTLLKKLQQNRQDFDWLRMKAKIVFENQQEKRTTSSTIYLRKDSLIWLNIKKLGVEAFRMQITPDSIYFINRLDKNYMIKPLSFIESRFNLAVNFKSLQALFLGNPIFLTKPQDLESDIKEDQYHLSGEHNNLANEYFLEADEYLLTKMNFADLSADRSVRIEQGSYMDGDEYKNFSYFRSIIINSTTTENTSIDLKVKKITINTPKKIYFEIPSHYTKVN